MSHMLPHSFQSGVVESPLCPVKWASQWGGVSNGFYWPNHKALLTDDITVCDIIIFKAVVCVHLSFTWKWDDWSSLKNLIINTALPLILEVWSWSEAWVSRKLTHSRDSSIYSFMFWLFKIMSLASTVQILMNIWSIESSQSAYEILLG